MRRTRLPVLVALLAVFLWTPAESKGRFDGHWRIYISAPPGRCEFGYLISVRVRDGLVSWHGFDIARSMIGISSGGAVAIRLSDGRNVVTGTGAIGTRSGTGRWAAPAFRCKGRWNAVKL